MIIPIETSVTIYDEWHATPTHLRVDLTEELIAWIKKMVSVVKRNKIAYLADYECSPEYFDNDDGELIPSGETLECVMIVVTDTEFYWKGVIKHTDIKFESGTISIKDLNKLIRFYKDPDIDILPKCINDEDYSVREIALRRMRGET
jgi:hypothetical protein